MTPTRVHLSVTSSDPDLITRAAEHFARAAAGFALDNAEVFMSIGPDEED